MESDYVFVQDDGKLYRPNYVSELFSKFILDNGLPSITLHGLRHSYASLSNEVGISLYETSKALGHSSTSTTSNIYTHIYKDKQEKNATLIANALNTDDKGQGS